LPDDLKAQFITEIVNSSQGNELLKHLSTIRNDKDAMKAAMQSYHFLSTKAFRYEVETIKKVSRVMSDDFNRYIKEYNLKPDYLGDYEGNLIKDITNDVSVSDEWRSLLKSDPENTLKVWKLGVDKKRTGDFNVNPKVVVAYKKTLSLSNPNFIKLFEDFIGINLTPEIINGNVVFKGISGQFSHNPKDVFFATIHTKYEYLEIGPQASRNIQYTQLHGNIDKLVHDIPIFVDLGWFDNNIKKMKGFPENHDISNTEFEILVDVSDYVAYHGRPELKSFSIVPDLEKSLIMVRRDFYEMWASVAMEKHLKKHNIDKDILNIYVHGSEDGLSVIETDFFDGTPIMSHEYSFQQVFDRIRKSQALNRREKVRLVTCCVGKNKELMKELANSLDVEIIAPENFVVIFLDSDGTPYFQGININPLKLEDPKWVSIKPEK